jgi:cellulose synthase/poly-beta-1,6-N-acetylglucosamine synthase-like glycosyltransferase
VPSKRGNVTISVMVPTYRRPQDLRRCLRALTVQLLPADEVIVVVRANDELTHEVLQEQDFKEFPVRIVTVAQPGQVAALNAGLEQVRTDVVAITDDDAAPHPDWTMRIVAHYSVSGKIGGVGGRDNLHINGVLQEGRASVVGKVPAVGKHIGNHHIGFGAPREVDTLKGVNCSYRTQAVRPIGFDRRLRGSGAQCHNDMSIGNELRQAGWKLIYDPQIVVDHYTAARFDEDQRSGFNPVATRNTAYNEALIRMTYLPPLRRVMFWCWSVLIGTRGSPGFAQWIRFLPSQGSLAGAKFFAAAKGRFDAWNETWRSVRRRA